MNFELSTLGDDYVRELTRTGKKFTVFSFTGHEAELLDIILSINTSDRIKTIAKHLIQKAETHSVVKNSDIIQEIHAIYMIPVTSIRRSLQDMVKEGFLVKPTVTLNDEPFKKATCYQFASKKQTRNIITRKEVESTLVFRGNSEGDRQSVKLAAQEKGLTLEDIDAKDYLHKIGMPYVPDAIPMQYMSLAPVKKNGKNYAKEEFNHVVGDDTLGRYAIEAKSHEQVTTAPALLTLMAMTHLSIAYNAKMLKLGKYQTPFENKIVPIHILDILYVKGLKDSGQARERIRGHILELRETIYNWSDLTGIKDENMRDIFTQKDFQFIVGLENNATIAPITDARGRIKASPVLFFVQFSDAFIEKLCNKKLFFTLPSKVVMDDPLLFTFYLVLRQKQRTRDSLLLKDIAEKMYYMNSTNMLYTLLTNRLNESYKIDSEVIDSEKGAFDYNLCGYYLKFNKNEDGDRTLHVLCDHEEMIRDSGATYNPQLREGNAPTLPNPLHSVPGTVEEIQMVEQATNIQNFLLQYHLDESTRRTMQYRRFFVADRLLEISPYSSEHDLERMVILISEELDVNEDIIELSLKLIQESLKPLAYAEFEVKQEQFAKLKSHMLAQHDYNLTDIQLIDLTKRFKLKNISLWVQGEYEKVAQEVVKRILA